MSLTLLHFSACSVCFTPQEQMANGVKSLASVPSSSVLLRSSYSVDRDVLKKLGFGLALAAAILAFIIEKLC